ncbi:helix-turn-helix domain-containing protein [uncultured Arcticibacterium sp.]|uniref:helix-turn-helix domain-containing protein n=1 Tax=uncultured Arcticibacterium sp. TaxID=2173042 RepID=UPI0030F9F4D0
MKTLIVLSIVQSAFLILLLLSKKEKSRSGSILSFWLLVMVLSQLFYLLVYHYPEALSQRLILVLACTPLLAGPAFLFYVAELTQSKLRFWPLHLIPYGVFVFYILLNADNLAIDNGFLLSINGSSLVSSYYGYLFVLIPFLYIVWSYSFFKAFEKRLKENYSNTEKINLDWLKKWILEAVIFMLVSFPTIYLATRFNLFPREYSFQFIAVFNTVYIFVVGYFGFKQTTIFSDVISLSENNPKYQKSGLNDQLADVYQSRLVIYIEKEKPFLNPNIKAKELAESLGISVNNLSQLLNQYEGKSFYQFINDLRIQEVVKLMNDKEFSNLSNEGLAYQSGFNARSTFTKAFKQKIGISPSEYRKKLYKPIG